MVMYIFLLYTELDLGSCAASSTGSRVSINCVPTNFLREMTCSFNEGSIVEDCGFPLKLYSQRFGDGYHTVVITITDEFSQTKTFIFGFSFISRKFKSIMSLISVCITYIQQYNRFLLSNGGRYTWCCIV